LICGGIALLSARLWASHIGNKNLYQRLGEVFVPITIATVLYYIIAYCLKVPAVNEIFSLAKSRISKIKSSKQK